MRNSYVVVGLALLSCLKAAQSYTIDHSVKRQEAAPAPFSDFTNNVIYTPPENVNKTNYGRTIQLPDGSILATFTVEDLPPFLYTFRIFKSVDGGATWSQISEVEDQVNGWGMRWQPNFYILPQDFGDYPAGTLIIGGTSTPTNRSEAYIDLYASPDEGYTWEFVSHIAYGEGPEDTNNGDKAIWEPFFLTYDNQLVCFYSDQRDPDHGQKLVHVKTQDLVDWSELTDDVADSAYTARPGMTVVAYIEPAKKYIMTYEDCGPQACAVLYRLSDSPLTFIDAKPERVVDNKQNIQLKGSPYVIWTPHPEKPDGKGLIIANGNSHSQVLVNDNGGSPDAWKAIDVGQNAAYSRMLNIIDVEGDKKLMLISANQGRSHAVSVGVVDIPV